jgi:hypothetical protein
MALVKIRVLQDTLPAVGTKPAGRGVRAPEKGGNGKPESRIPEKIPEQVTFLFPITIVATCKNTAAGRMHLQLADGRPAVGDAGKGGVGAKNKKGFPISSEGRSTSSKSGSPVPIQSKASDDGNQNRKGPGSLPGPNLVFRQNEASSDSVA